MIRKLLIANRGEIACRIMDTAKAMGIQTVAVYSDADENALHVNTADQAVHIGGAEAANSYLCIDRVVQAALETGADAIHPGYGFLSENPEFVEAVEAAGLTFVGPSAHTMRAMGLKDAAKTLMAAAGVPVVPGYEGEDQSIDVLAKAADKIGYPVLIKAVAGGGGKGMRLVETPDAFEAALARAKNEARAAFGNDHVLIEKYITSPRHIEVQIFGDGTDVVHLYERDCSLQRRHQKVIEEAPAPDITPDVRDAITTAAVRAAKATDYKSAGTVEFIADGSGALRADGFWFMEMNTRLQVEHPVTEAITGIDLVAWQLKVAGGDTIPMDQADIPLHGHAVEARLYAEDPANGFLPVTGTLAHLKFPDDARIDTGVLSGDEISPFYDPMIAKITVHGANRETALSMMDQALERTEISGTTTNLAFLKALNSDADFQAANLDTGLIDRKLDTLIAPKVPCTKTRAIAALVALNPVNSGFAIWSPLRWKVQLGDDEIWIERGEDWSVTVGETTHKLRNQNGAWFVDGRKTAATTFVDTDSVSVFWGNTYVFDRRDPLSVGSDTIGGGDVVTAPMPGKIISLFAKAGDVLTEGDPVAVLEAMKMEHTLTAPRDGTVDEMSFAETDLIKSGDVIMRFVLE